MVTQSPTEKGKGSLSIGWGGLGGVQKDTAHTGEKGDTDDTGTRQKEPDRYSANWRWFPTSRFLPHTTHAGNGKSLLVSLREIKRPTRPGAHW